MSGLESEKTVLIGIGNADRRDDAAGLEVVRRLCGRLPESMVAVEAAGEATELMAAWEGADRAVVVDAMSSDAPPGRVRRFQAHEKPIPTNVVRRSSHEFGLFEAIELSRRLGTLPRRVLVYGLEGSQFGYGTGLSPEVSRAVEVLADRIAAELLTRD